MSHPEPDPLRSLADDLKRAGLRDAAALALDIFAPLDVISSQIAQFSRPFFAGHPWEIYAATLADRGAWPALRSLLARDEC